MSWKYLTNQNKEKLLRKRNKQKRDPEGSECRNCTSSHVRLRCFRKTFYKCRVPGKTGSDRNFAKLHTVAPVLPTVVASNTSNAILVILGTSTHKQKPQ